MIKKLIPLILLFLLSYFSWKILISPGFFSIHDDQQIARLFELDKSLTAGQFPVRWVKDLGFGYGYPLFNFYPPLVYYLGEVFHGILGTGLIVSTKIVWFLALVGSAMAMYRLAKEFFGKYGGIVSSLFYLYAPYHAVDAYVRGALAELFSFVWLPLILLFSYKSIKENDSKYSLLTGIMLALLMITHNLIFLPFIGLFLLWYVAMFLIYGNKKFSFIIYHLSFIISLCFGLTAFFWAPALAEKQYTLVDQLLTKSLASYKIHFVCPGQLWDSPWGFGGSVPGCVDGLSFKIGKLHILLSLVSILVVVYLWIKKERKLSLLLGTTFLILLFSLFMTTEYSSFIWDHIPQLWYLQFPWRFLEFVTLFTSLLAGSIFALVKKRSLKIVLAVILLGILVIPNAKYFTPQTFLTQATDAILTSDQEIKWRVSSTSFEYLPAGMATTLTDQGAVMVDIHESEIAQTDYKIVSGYLTINNAQIAPDRFLIKAKAIFPSVLQMQIVNFPGWQIWLDNDLTTFQDSNRYKLITINIPPGEHTIMGRFTNTPVRTWGNLVSLLFLAGLAIYGFRNGIRRSP